MSIQVDASAPPCANADCMWCHVGFVSHVLALLQARLPIQALTKDEWYALVQQAHKDLHCGHVVPSTQFTAPATTPSRKRPAEDDLDGGRTTHEDDAMLEDLVNSSVVLSDVEGTQGEPPVHLPPFVSPSSGGALLPDTQIQGPAATEPPAEVNCTTKVSHNNRRAEAARQKKADARRLKKRQDQGLLPPPNDADSVEKATYAAFDDKDCVVIGWIMARQAGTEPDAPFFPDVTTKPYTLAAGLVRKAQAVGNDSSRLIASSFVREWRLRGTPFQLSAAVAPLLPSSVATPGDNSVAGVDRNFRSAWARCSHYEAKINTVHVEYRWSMALLAQAYEEKYSAIQDEDAAEGRGTGRNRGGRGKVSSEAQAALRHLVGLDDSPKSRILFTRRLQFATRWLRCARVLGWGILCIMPYDLISNTWIESTRKGILEIWLQLVKRINADAYDASQAFEMWLGSGGVAGGSLSGKERLSIEDVGAAASRYDVVTRVDEGERSDDDTEEEVFASSQMQREVLELRPASQIPLGQLTLVQLMQPG